MNRKETAKTKQSNKKSTNKACLVQRDLQVINHVHQTRVQNASDGIGKPRCESRRKNSKHLIRVNLHYHLRQKSKRTKTQKTKNRRVGPCLFSCLLTMKIVLHSANARSSRAIAPPETDCRCAFAVFVVFEGAGAVSCFSCFCSSTAMPSFRRTFDFAGTASVCACGGERCARAV